MWTKVEHILVLYGADFFGRPVTRSIMPLIHLVGVGLVVGAWSWRPGGSSATTPASPCRS